MFERQLSRTFRFLIFLILFLLSIINKSAEIAISLQKYDKILKIYDDPDSIYSKKGIILGDFLFIIISQIENRKIVTFICFLLNGILYKTAFMYIYLTNMIGYFFELLVIFIIYSNEWYVNATIFKIFGGLAIIFDCLLLVFPNKYLSYKYNFIGYKVEGKEEFTKIENSGQSSFFENQEDNNNEIGFKNNFK